MAVAIARNRTYTAEEYLTLEVDSEIRSEFRNGKIVEMTGGTPAHNQISGATYALLWFALRKQPYSVFVTDQRLWIPAVNLYTYPDLMVVANPVTLKPGRKDTVMDALLVIEVLSSSTEDYDHNQKFANYRTIEAFQEYVLIDQYRPRVEHYVKQAENQWLFTEYSGLDAHLVISSVNVEIALADIYESISFEAKA